MHARTLVRTPHAMCPYKYDIAVCYAFCAFTWLHGGLVERICLSSSHSRMEHVGCLVDNGVAREAHTDSWQAYLQH